MEPDRLAALLADAVAEQAGRERAEARLLRQAAEEGATLAGVLVDLVERSEPVSVRTVGGRTHRGRLQAVGRDFLVIRDNPNPPAFVRISAVATIRSPRDTRHDTASDRRPPVDASFAAVVAGLAAERPRVQVSTGGDDTALTGLLRAAGHDVLTLRLESGDRATVYVPIASVRDLVLLDL